MTSDGPMPASRRPELLSPAGDWEALRAAVANGADAVYFGLPNFNARHRANNFTLEELPELMRYLHARNVKGFLTFNTLIFSEELPDAVAYIRAIAAAGVDAVIVQDLGLALLLRALAPTLPLHGSTQMTLTEPRGIELVRGLGVERVVLARELSIDDIRRIAGATTMELEVFIHGALCVAYSGQCLTSESLGGRSANRGQCAQACRLPYDLIVDGAPRDLGDKAYLLSPQDLAAHDLVGDLARLGVACLKIEGRLKSAHYVAATTQTYRAAIDAFAGGAAFALSPERRDDLAQTFSRGFTHGFLDGVNHQRLVSARFPKSRGLRVGTVVEAAGAGVVVRLEPGRSVEALRPGDGVVFDEGHPEQDEQGGRVFAVAPAGPGRARIELRRGDVNARALVPGALVWKTDDPALRRRLEHSYARDEVARRQPLDATLEAHAGRPPALCVRAGGFEGEARGDAPLQAASKFPVDEAAARAQIGRLGDTPFELRSLTLESSGSPMAPRSVLNDLRRRAVADLLRRRDAAARHGASCSDVLGVLRERARRLAAGEAPEEPRLSVLVRTMAQLQAVLAETRDLVDVVYCDFEDVRRYRDAVGVARAAGATIALATLRVVKPHEEGLLRQIASAEPDAVLVRNLAGVGFYREHAPSLPMHGDYALNVANELTAGIFAEAGVRRLTPSYDLNWRQLRAMIAACGAGLFEAVVHQHMPMFHMEHCVFAHTLSDGKDFHDCGRPCERHAVDLRDRMGVDHALIPDVGCRNTVFNGQAQSAADYIPRMLELGLRRFRVELLREEGTDAASLVRRYADVIRGVTPPRRALTALRVLSQLGVTAGTLERE